MIERPSTIPTDSVEITVPKAEAITALCELVSHGDEADRCYACHALGVLGDDRTIAVLSDRLRDEDIDVCVDAATALGKIGDPDVVPTLLDSLTHDPSGEVKTAIIEALGEISSSDVVRTYALTLLEN